MLQGNQHTVGTLSMFIKDRGSTNWLLNIPFPFQKGEKAKAHANELLNHALFKFRELTLWFVSALTSAFLRIKTCSGCSLFFGTTNLKRTVTPRHGAV